MSVSAHSQPTSSRMALVRGWINAHPRVVIVVGIVVAAVDAVVLGAVL